MQQAVEVVGVDAHLVLNRRQLVGLADAVRYEGAVVDAPWHVALVARQQQDVVEVEVARLEHTHDLHALGRLAVEGDGGLLDELLQQALQRGVCHDQIAAADESVEAVDERVAAEQRLLEQRVLYFVLGAGGYLAQEGKQLADEVTVRCWQSTHL